jgi:hypothetical protein
MVMTLPAKSIFPCPAQVSRMACETKRASLARVVGFD